MNQATTHRTSHVACRFIGSILFCRSIIHQHINTLSLRAKRSNLLLQRPIIRLPRHCVPRNDFNDVIASVAKQSSFFVVARFIGLLPATWDCFVVVRHALLAASTHPRNDFVSVPLNELLITRGLPDVLQIIVRLEKPPVVESETNSPLEPRNRFLFHALFRV
jgi:hypothetical protein